MGSASPSAGGVRQTPAAGRPEARGQVGRDRGNGRGAPAPARRRRLVGGLLPALLTAATAAALTAAAQPAVPAPPPAAVRPRAAAALPEAYRAHRADAVAAARLAAAHGDRRRAAAERALTVPGRNLLAFDGRGAGRVTEVLGDLGHADRIAVLVPGSDTSLDTYGRFLATATALYADLAHRAPAEPRPVVVAWLGYDTPATAGTAVTTTTRADRAAPALAALTRELRALAPAGARLSLLCHSYGSVVCARAAHAVDVDDLVLVGSPGTGAADVSGLRTSARVWAARGSRDWVSHVPHLRVVLPFGTVGFGTDPVSPSFGARVFDAADAGHSGYFAPGSVSLANLARITLGERGEVTGARG
ncbi:alpha/beta hydrolase [Streptomyces sp. NPDC046860]|uniref:alpha/beta hydrolase n=1 Tax=Streptomyces sp. NPDC046860 TaxID=3154495 RepID=UPI0033D468BB